MNEAEKSLDLGMMCVFEQKLWLHRFGFVACKLAFDAPSALLCFFKPLCNDDKCNEYTVLENPPKSRIQHCERSELSIHFERTKVH